MNNLLLYIGGLLVAIFGALFAVPAMIDWNGYRGVFEEEASKALGRDVRVAGNVNLRLLPTPFVRFEKVRFADLSGQTGEPFFRTESFTMRLSGPALLRGIVEAKDIELEKPTLALAIDDQGSGNWRDIRIASAPLPFGPKAVTLRAVRIIDGTVSFYRSGARKIAEIVDVNGSFAADDLDGPYRFNGAVKWGGITHNIRFASSERSTDGGFRIKAASRAEDRPLVINVDANVDVDSGRPSLTGKVSGTLPVLSRDAVIPPDEANPEYAKDAIAEPVMDFEADIDGNTLEASLNDMALTLRDTTIPQVISGNARFEWQQTPKTTVALNAKWFDLDHLAGAGTEGAAFSRIKQFALSTMDAVSGEGSADIKVDLEQVKLGGETAGGLKLNLVREGRVVELKEFRASLPGGSRVGLNGHIRQRKSGPVFRGMGFVHGTSLARLRQWAERSGTHIDIIADGAFSADGKLLISKQRFELSGASVEIAGQPMTGELTIAYGERPRTEITVESTKLEAAVLFPSTTKALAAELSQALGLQSSTSDTAASETDTESKQRTDGEISLRVLAGELRYADKTFHHVDASFDVASDQITIERASGKTNTGLDFMVEGHAARGTEGGKASGVLAFDVEADNPAALGQLFDSLELGRVFARDRLTGWQNAKLAGSVQLGKRTDTTADITVNGTLGGARVSFIGEFDDGLGDWRAAPTRMRFLADNATLGQLLSGLGRTEKINSPDSNKPAEMRIALAGTLTEEARTSFSIISERMKLGFDGRTGWRDGEAFRIVGDLDVDAADVRDVLLVSGIRATTGIAGTRANGRLNIGREGSNWTLAADQFRLGPELVSLSGTVNTKENDISQIQLSVDVNQLSLASLTSAMLKPAASVLAASGISSDGADAVTDLDDSRITIWPEGTLSFEATRQFAGTVNLRFNSFELSRGLVTGAGTAKVALAPAGVVLNDFVAAAAGGKIRGDVRLGNAPGGTSVDLKIAAEDIQLSQINASSDGRMSFDLDASGRGQDISNIIALLRGNGQIELKDAVVPLPNIIAVANAADQILSATPQNNETDAGEILAAGYNTRPNKLGDRKAALNIADGHANFAPIRLNSARGHGSVASVLNLDTLSFESAAQISVEPSPYKPDVLPEGWHPPKSKGALPAMVVLYTGSLAGINIAEREIDTAAMQREIVVRQMERNVQELERLRLLDVQQAERGAERRATEAERRRLEREGQVAPIEEEPDSQTLEYPQNNSDSGVAYDQTPQAGVQTPPAEASPEQSPAGDPEADNAETSDAAAVEGEDAGQPGAEDAQAAQPPPRPRIVRRQHRKSTTAKDNFMRSLGGYP